LPRTGAGMRRGIVCWLPVPGIREPAGTSCPADNKISLSNKFYMMSAGTLAPVSWHI